MISRPVPRSYSNAPDFQHHAPNAALLIDFDNVTMGIRSDLGKELKSLLNSDVIRGKVAVQRAYADWRRYPQYIVPLAESSIDLIFAPAYGSSKKNATDLRMAIDAMELIFTRPEIGTFILMTGDSDFSSCVLKLKEYGKYVIGVGMRESSSDLLIQNCDEYYSYHSLSGLRREGEVEESKEDPWVLVKRAAQQMIANRDVMRTDRLKQVMLELDPAFDEKKIGYTKFSRFVQEAATKGSVKLRKGENGQYEIVADDDGSGVRAGEPAAPREPREPREEGGRGRGRGRGRDRDRDRERADGRREERPAAAAPEPLEADEGYEAAAEAPGAPARVEPDVVAAELELGTGGEEPAHAATPQLSEAYSLLQEAVRSLTGGSAGKSIRDGDVKRKMLAVSPGFDEAALGFSKFTRFLREAHDAEAIDLKRVNGGNYEVSLPASGKRLPAPTTGRMAADTSAAREPREPREASEPRKPREAAATAAEPRAERATEPAAAAPTRERAPAPAAAPAAAAPAVPASGLRGRRGGRGAPLAGPPPILPGQVIGTARSAAPVATPAASTAAPTAAPAPEAVAEMDADTVVGDEKGGKGRSRRGRRGRGKGRGEAPEAADEAAVPVAESGPETVAEPESVEEPAGAVRGRRGRGRKAAPVAEGVAILPGQAAAAPRSKAAAEAPAEPAAAKTRARGGRKSAAKTPPAAPSFPVAELGLPHGREEILGYITGSYRGIGRKTAEALVDSFGDDVFRTLEQEPERVRELLGAGRSQTILDQWATDYGRRRGPEAPAAAAPAGEEDEAGGDETGAAAKSRAKSRGRRGGRGRTKRPGRSDA